MNNSLKHLHNIRIIAVEKMLDGIKKYGVMNPKNDPQLFSYEGMEEAADSYNYAAMLETPKVLCEYKLSIENRELLLKKLESIALDSLLLGVKWSEYDEKLQQFLKDQEPENETPESN